MSNEHASCVFCGEFVLHIPGWASSVPSYRLMRATWQEDHAFVVGSLHFSCLRASPARSEFAAEFAQIATGHGREITYQAAGETQTLIQPGLGYVEQIFRGDECAIHRSDTRDSWLVQEYAGPWYVLDRPQLEDIAQGKQPRLDPGVERIVLPGEPMANLADATLSELLDSLGVTDRYPGLAAGEPEYEFWKYFAPKRVLEYAVIATPPLPTEATTFLRGYAPGYQPIDFDALERDEPRS
ncbi:hypothetical protein ACFY3G_24850 [Streptomyces phaeochromogenes]|uniref:hypothetical protein n=1 Tax=Streptomyces phaeochromogenes TaxID=1923 RepID=UPI00368F8B1E